MGFSVKLAPGVRIRASSRGVRAGIGPRAMRVHVGSGRTGISTGIGPFGAYTSSGRRRSTSRKRSSGGTSIAAYKRQVAVQNRQDKIAAAKALLTQFQAISEVHRAEFPPAQKPDAARPLVPPLEHFYPEQERAALKGIGPLKMALRKEAKVKAKAAAEAQRNEMIAAYLAAHAQEEREIDEWWTKLLDNDPEVVIEALEDAFEDNEAPAAAVGVHGTEVAVVVLAPGIDVVPDKMPEVTAAGNVSLKAITKVMRTTYYNMLLLGQMIVTMRETFAVAPGAESVRVILIRGTDIDAYGKKHAECLAAALFERSRLVGVQWATADAGRIFNDVPTDTALRQIGASKELKPIDLSEEPDLQALLNEVDLTELVA